MFPNISSKDELLNNKEKLKGSVVKINNFLSTGITDGSGFFGNVEYIVVLPEDTKAVYAEPFSHYGKTAQEDWDGSPHRGNNDVGSEAEIIVQAGTS